LIVKSEVPLLVIGLLVKIDCLDGVALVQIMAECLGDGGLVVALKLMSGVVYGLRGHFLPAERPEGWEVRLSKHSLVRLDDYLAVPEIKK
jgi:hypothetical protein